MIPPPFSPSSLRHRSVFSRPASGLLSLAALTLLPFTSLRTHGAEAPQVLAGYGSLEWIAGLSGETDDNGNEWNFADGLDAREAELSEPHSAMADLNGNIIVADKNAHAIRMIRTDNTIHTVAGINTAGYDGDGPAVERQLNGPQTAYPMPDGSFYILDTGNKMIRKVDAAGMMTTVIRENEALSRGLWVRRDHSLIYYCTNTGLRRWTPAMGGGPGTPMISGLQECGNIDVAANGDVYVTDRTLSQVFRVPPDATPSTFVPVVVAGTGGNTDNGPKSNGKPALQVALRGVRGIAFHPLGGYFLATHKGGDIWYVDTAGNAMVVVNGDDGTTHSAEPQPLPTSDMVIGEPRFVSVAPNGDLLMATNDAGYIRRARYIGPTIAAPAVVPSWTAGGGLKLEWTDSGNRWYRVESSSDPSHGWSFQGLIAPPYAGPVQWSDLDAGSGGSRRFLRVTSFRNWPN